MLTSNSLLLSSNLNQRIENTYYPPSPPLSTSVTSFRSPPMSKTSLLSNPFCPPSNKMVQITATESSSFLNLEKVVQAYGSQPELLELILSSKVEEDKRRAEEAKLRRKEIDYMLQKQPNSDQPTKKHQQQEKSYSFNNNSNGNTALPPISSTKSHYNNQRMNSFSSNASVGSVDSTLPRLHHHNTKLTYQHDSVPSSNNSGWRHSSSNSHYLSKPTPLSSPSKRRNSSNIEMLLIPSPKSLELKLPELSLTPSSSSSTIKNIVSLNYPNNRSRSSSLLANDDSEEDGSEEEVEEGYNAAGGPAPPSPLSESGKFPKASRIRNAVSKTGGAVHKRRRREMQAITTIIETREFPYNDDYLWKNNGNTVHKKTGFKSIYYKCSNSSKGCPVNKTVTFKDNGEYLIKYRGQHLSECNRIKRITDL